MKQRAFPRFAIDAAVELRVAGAPAHGRTQNISRGGLCVELDRALALGTAVEVAITLVFDDDGRSEPLVVAAWVAWSTALESGHQVGVRFGTLRPRDATFLEMFLRYLGDRDDSTGDETIDDAASDDPFA